MACFLYRKAVLARGLREANVQELLTGPLGGIHAVYSRERERETDRETE